MAISDMPMLSALRTKMQWHQERQRVLAENISNANTPNFKPRDLIEPKFDAKGSPASVGGTMGSLAMMRTSSSHMSVSGGVQTFNGGPKKVDMQSIFLTPIAITKDNLNVVIDAGWISKEEACQGVKADTVAACK